MQWENEFFDLKLKDKRLQKRFFQIMEQFAAKPQDSILSANGTRSSAKASYRFFANEVVSYEKLLDSISKATIEKIKQIETENILLVQDTTAISFGNRKGIEGMGYYCDSAQKGMLVHSCIAITDTGIPVGLVFQKISTRATRKNNTNQTKEQRKFRSVEEKESFRWLDTLRECHTRVPPGISKITVCDREGDFYELFAEAEQLQETFLVRLTHNRMTENEKSIKTTLKQSEVKGTIVLQIARNNKEHLPSRKVVMDYHYETVEIKKPHRRKETHLQNQLKLSAIYVHETGKTNGLEWFLLTNQPVSNAKEAEKQIQNYVQRWKIERFHYVLKSGCRIEEKQSRSYEKLKVLTALYSVIALQILNMTYLGKISKEVSGELFLEENEWKVLYCAARKTPYVPEGKYTVYDVISHLAMLGGRKGAPSDGMPGVSSIWKGLETLYILLAYRDFLK